MITFENVSKEYEKGRPVVSELQFEINDGEFFVLIGPSGSGKTTTLKMINRLISLSSGVIKIGGKRISDYPLNELRWNIGYVLQQIALFPHMTVEENISLVPEMKGWHKQEISSRVTELLKNVGMDPIKYRDRKPAELSGGEQQRIGIARALAADPDIILMDEPFSALDPITRKQLQQDLLNMKKELNKTIVFVTHDMKEALILGDRICIFNKGKTVQIGTPGQIVQEPKNDFVRTFVASGDIITDKKYTVSDVLQEGFWTKDNMLPEAFKSITENAAIASALQLLSEEEAISILDHEENRIGSLSRQQLLAFLAAKAQKEGEK